MPRQRIYLPPDRTVVINLIPELLRKDLVAGTYIAEAAPAVKGELTAEGKPYTYFHLIAEPGEKSIGARAQLIDTKINDSTDPTALIGDMQMVPIPSDAIADDLMRMFSDYAHLASEEAKPGVLVLDEGQVEPTDEQIADALRRQEAYARRIVMEARQFLQENKMDRISPNHYLWAKWIGQGDDPFKLKAMTGEMPSDGNNSVLASLVLAQQEQIAELKNMIAKVMPAQAVQPPLSPTQPKAVK